MVDSPPTRGGAIGQAPRRPIATARCSCRICIWERAVARPHLILDMLRHIEADTIYLVGDIIDGWRLRSGWYWPQAHNDVIQKLLRKVRRGARMVFVPGNHDEFARQFFGLTFGGIEIKRQAIHAAADGKRYLVIARRRVRRGRAPLEVARLLRRLGLRLRAVRQHAFQRRAPGARPALLVVLGLGQAQGQERGQFHRLVRDANSPAKPGGAASTASSAAISITRPSARSTASPMSTPAISSNPARSWSNTSTAGSRSCAGGAAARPCRTRTARPGGRARSGGGGSGLMRILIATDAWRPQVNGVVSTLERMTPGGGRIRREVRIPDAPGHVDRAAADLSRKFALALTAPGRDRPADRGGRARPYPHRHRGADRLAGAAPLPERKARLHHELSHPLSGIHSARAPASPKR